MKRFIALSRRGNVAPSGILFIGMLLVSFSFVGCGGKLGKIETSVVDTAIADAEVALAAAVDVDAAITGTRFAFRDRGTQISKSAKAGT